MGTHNHATQGSHRDSEEKAGSFERNRHRDRNILVVAKNKLSVSVQGMEEMDFRIETKEAFRIVGKSCPLSKVLEENFARIPHEWDIALENGTLAKLYGIMNDKPEGLLGVSVHNEKEWKYFIAVSSTEDSDNFEQYNIPVATWAVFSGRGTNVSLQELERRVITEWLPTSGYEYAEIPDIEVYIK